MTHEIFEGTEYKINLGNVDKKIEGYLKTIQDIKLPITQSDVLKTIYSIKRDPLNTGPYLKVSLFEAARSHIRVTRRTHSGRIASCSVRLK